MQIIVVGCGKVGKKLVAQLSREDNNITVVDTNAALVESVSTLYDVMGVTGNGSSFSVLSEADIENADMMIAVTDSDEVNLLCCVIARRARCLTVARVRNPIYSQERDFLRKELGISMIINPELEAAREVARLFRYPFAIEVDRFAKGRADLLRFRVPADSALAGRALKDLARETENVLICIAERNGSVQIPDGNYVIESGDILSVIFDPVTNGQFFKKIGVRTNQIRNTLIIGGSKLAFYVAKTLEHSDIDVRIIEKNLERCEQMAEVLKTADIVNGDGSDHEFLREERIDQFDSMLASTTMDEQNIILSLYAKDKIHYKVVTDVSHIEVSGVIKTLELDSIISPKSITAETILQFVRATANGLGSNVETLYQLIDGEVEALEFFIQQNAPVVGIQLMDLHLKNNILIAGIVRAGRLIIPGGRDQIQAGDSVIVVTTNTGYTDINDILA
ncbi:MAG: Trk system potassium transporter TrkA [Eubacterium sp.]|nr:Trk system potassium transporter TrkA [Eubacterium sp.]